MPKPLLTGDAALTYGQIEKMREQRARWDDSYVPGYSEKSRENQLRINRGEDPVPMPRLQWIRIRNVNNEDVGMPERVNWHMLGYQLCTKEDLEKHGWGMPPAATIDVNGNIRRLDQALAIVDAAQAERNREYQKQQNAQFHATPLDSSNEDDRRSEARVSLDELKQSLD